MESKLEIDKNGDKYWKLPNGDYHRENGPAIERINGSKFWFYNGKCHRENKPAIEHDDGSKEWFLNGKRHREDGPSVEWGDGELYNGIFHLEDILYTEKKYYKEMRLRKLKKILG